MTASVLLDTNAVIWLVTGRRMAKAAREAINEAAEHGNVLISSISGWEIGLLVSKSRLLLDRPFVDWLANLKRLAGVRIIPLSLDAAVGASLLPGSFHAGPGDRLLVATARELAVPLVTRDQKILDYARSGAVKAIAC